MKFEKKHWVMLGVGLAILIVVIIMFKKKKPAVTESSFNPNILIPGESGFKQVNRCACASGNETGTCVKNNGLLSCQDTVVLPTGGPPPGARMMAGDTKPAKLTCPGGTVLSDCYKPDGTSFKCCASPNN